MKRIKKGEYGYIAYQKKWSVIRTVIFFAICLAIFAVGYVTTGSRKNLLTIVAILGCLPACKSAVNVVMFLRARGCSEEAHTAIEKVMNESGICGIYDLYMTSYKTNFPVSHLVISGNMIIALAEENGTDLNALQSHIEDHLKQDGVKNVTVKAYDSISKYTDRIEQLGELAPEPLKNQDSIVEMLISISL